MAGYGEGVVTVNICYNEPRARLIFFFLPRLAKHFDNSWVSIIYIDLSFPCHILNAQYTIVPLYCVIICLKMIFDMCVKLTKEVNTSGNFQYVFLAAGIL